MPIRFALMEDHLTDARAKSLPACLRAVFVRSGSVRISGAGRDVTLQTGDCQLFTYALTLTGPGECWSFEMSAAEAKAPLSEDDMERLVYATPIERDPHADILIRADRVDFPPGTVTPRHGHKGPGIRRLLQGILIAEVGDEIIRIEAGDVWFEAGPDPVVGRTLAPDSAFVRVMVLDPSLYGQPTFIPCSPEDARAPRGTNRTLFFDTVTRLST